LAENKRVFKSYKLRNNESKSQLSEKAGAAQTGYLRATSYEIMKANHNSISCSVKYLLGYLRATSYEIMKANHNFAVSAIK